ncbi:MAG: threonylcarbamoyl-AMP synthase [Bacteroidales bacterium]|jgi:tRNA threonylcarbamoyl adenosine modification protein (Sua5/YciO/YrdC/YwlC family)|nr:threonylcarbamoyl-AMP synthase [Bacteroidales bacterium]MBP5135167.1 threonylcarbamoyl-AMP synthase [Paludibacteraceae bacterium]MBR6311019.1 threonylcarbamoyl-AMP synthase [Paludibacteraceae bacterium]
MLLKIYPENPNERDVQRIAEIVRNGGVIIFPTDTIYGIGCDIFNTKAVEKVCRIKGLDPNKNRLSFICNDLSQLSEFAKVDNRTFKLMRNCLPGPYTFILNGSSNLPKLFKNKKTVGIRIPDNNIIQTIVKELGHPMMTTSVKNDDDEVIEYISDPELIHEKYKKLVDIVIDGGYGEVQPSTIIDCTDEEPTLVRQGLGPVDF